MPSGTLVPHNPVNFGHLPFSVQICERILIFVCSHGDASLQALLHISESLVIII